MLTENAKATGKLLNLVAYRKQVKGDPLLERTVADLMANGTDELRAHIIAINTCRDGSQRRGTDMTMTAGYDEAGYLQGYYATVERLDDSRIWHRVLTLGKYATKNEAIAAGSVAAAEIDGTVGGYANAHNVEA